MKRLEKNKSAIIIGIHPGTVDSPLSEPYQKNIPKKQLFTPEFSTQNMLNVLQKVTPKDTGKHFAWDGSEILP